MHAAISQLCTHMGTCTCTWKWLLYEKKENKDPGRSAHISEKASGSCTNLKILFQFMLGISHSLAHNPVPYTDHVPENNPVGQTRHLLPTQHRGTTRLFPSHSPTGLPQQRLFSKVTPKTHAHIAGLKPSKALLLLCEDKSAVTREGGLPEGHLMLTCLQELAP